MKEIVYMFHARGCYLADERAIFKEETHIRFIVKPHTFELKISGEKLRDSSCEGFVVEVSHKGEVCFYDDEGNLLSKVNETQMKFVEAKFSWKPNVLSVDFGHEETVDYYPNCDGEYDRWGTEWVSDYRVDLNTATNQTETFISK